MHVMYPEVKGHNVFGPEVEGGCGNTLDLFSWSDRARLSLTEVTFPRALPMLPGRALSGLYTSRVGGGSGESAGERVKAEAGYCYRHVCISKTSRG